MTDAAVKDLADRPGGRIVTSPKRDAQTKEERDRDAIAVFMRVYRRALEELEKH